MFGRSRRDLESFSIPQFEPDGLLFMNARSLRAFYSDDAPPEAQRFADGYLLGIANATTVLLEKVTDSIPSKPEMWPSLERVRSAFITFVDAESENGEMPAGQAALAAFTGMYLTRVA